MFQTLNAKAFRYLSTQYFKWQDLKSFKYEEVSPNGRKRDRDGFMVLVPLAVYSSLKSRDHG